MLVRNQHEAYRTLWVFVLIRAIKDLKLTGVSSEVDRRGAVWWFQNESNDEPNSFRAICHMMGYDHKKLRRTIFDNIDRLDFRDFEKNVETDEVLKLLNDFAN